MTPGRFVLTTTSISLATITILNLFVNDWYIVSVEVITEYFTVTYISISSTFAGRELFFWMVMKVPTPKSSNQNYYSP